MGTRITAYWTKWRDLCTKYGDMCWYCGEEAATTIDHVIPHSYDTNSDIDNLRPACPLCNCLASDKMFPSAEEKRWYILDKLRHRHDLRHAFCTECGIAFAYRLHGPSLFLCPECYDLEYGTKLSQRRAWIEWVALHAEAGWPIAVYRRAGEMYRDNGCRGGHKFLVLCLMDAMRQEEAKYKIATKEIESFAVRIPTT